MDTRMKVNLFVNVLGTVGVALILFLAIQINEKVTRNTTTLSDVLRRVDHVERETELLEARVLMIERTRAPEK